jgi:fermentation-respiration switch protein FrsA (DUF1100 family)
LAIPASLLQFFVEMKKLSARIQRVAGLLLTCLLIVIMLRWFEHHQVYHPGRVFNSKAADLARPFEDVLFKTKDGLQLNGWFFPAGTNSTRTGQALLLCHGNAGNIGDRLDMCQALLETGVNVFLFDYRGYGRSEGRPSEEGTYLDAQAAYQWLVQKGIPGTNIIGYGESLGGGVVTELAVREKLGGLILQSTFCSIPDIGAELFPWLPVRLIGKIKYDTSSKLPGLRLPVMVMHSREDGLIRFHHAERNFALANQPKVFWELKGDHNDPVLDRAQYVAGIEKLLGMLDGKPVSAADAVGKAAALSGE